MYEIAIVTIFEFNFLKFIEILNDCKLNKYSVEFRRDHGILKLLLFK